MADKQFLLVVYDISDDRRRTKLHDALLNYGSPVQYSVFECLLSAKERQRMHKAIGRAIRPQVDQVRTYCLCKECLAKTEVTAGADVLTEPKTIVV